MNIANFHLITNHLPVVGIIFSFLLVLYALIKNKDEVHRVAMLTIIVTAIFAIPAFFSGEGAEHLLKKYLASPAEWKKLKEFIEPHEDLAHIAFIFMLFVGVVSIVGLFLFRRPKNVPKWFLGVLLVLLIGVGIVMGKTGNLGGQIRHSEIRKDFKAPEKTKDNTKHEEKEKHEKDHD